jgi:ABC-type Fe3+-siderophore transport system permease subunit
MQQVMKTKDFIEVITTSRLWLYTIVICIGIVLSVLSGILFELNLNDFLAELIASIISAPLLAEFVLFIKRKKNRRN